MGRVVTDSYEFTAHALNWRPDLLCVDAGRLDAMLLTHGHYDHFGGLIAFLRAHGHRLRPDLPLAVREEECFRG